ncbi:glycosyltransferase family 4 protein [Pseudoxanthomonas kaohsiungensis]|uniref:Glycosyltransferase family 4 protein n=1 Tax=Pseudoxanthomonas kaohsiungensis TaxID=283923 RepID=A0ABW3LSU3_9GAMM|nr:glycosyltransferase family 1 protein [Pseudoxanthomonas kaohsiungensis]
MNPQSVGPGFESAAPERDLKRDNWELRCRLAEARHSLSQARAEVDRMLHSRSWRATRLMRVGLDRVRELLRPRGVVPPPTLRSQSDFAPAAARGDEPLLLVDVTELAIENLQGGIQHTVKGILSELLLAPPEGWRVAPVQLTREGVYVSASRDLEYLFGPFDDSFSGRHISVRERDVFLGLDLLRDHSAVFRDALARLRGAGVQINVVVYDLLPIDLPHCVPEHISRSFAQWLDVVGDLADGALCISQSVAHRFLRWMSARSGRKAGITVDSFRLGVPNRGGQAPGRKVVQCDDSAKFLMVGTVEPRKGYVDALDAFDRIWIASPDSGISLTIVGRYGWGLRDFLSRLEAHPELGRRLNWLRSATDDEVHDCYRSADGLLFCSYGEGFGLPIVEAAQHGLPMLLRDLPEFREVAGDGAFFFSEPGADGVEGALLDWLELRRQGAVPRPSAAVAITWEASARELLGAVARVQRC